MPENIDEATVRSFGDEWSRFDQSAVAEEELERTFSEYFAILPAVGIKSPEIHEKCSICL